MIELYWGSRFRGGVRDSDDLLLGFGVLGLGVCGVESLGLWDLDWEAFAKAEKDQVALCVAPLPVCLPVCLALFACICMAC